MRKTVLALSLAMMAGAATTASAADNTGPGCGWGQMVWAGKTGLLAHISAATTNGTSYNQWFGITSGTGGCKDSSTVNNDYERKLFVASNLDNLAHEAAQGQGSHLSSLAEIMGVPETDKPAFFSMAQQNYAALFTGSDMLSALDQAMQQDQRLAKYVR